MDLTTRANGSTPLPGNIHAIREICGQTFRWK